MTSLPTARSRAKQFLSGANLADVAVQPVATQALANDAHMGTGWPGSRRYHESPLGRMMGVDGRRRLGGVERAGGDDEKGLVA